MNTITTKQPRRKRVTIEGVKVTFTIPAYLAMPSTVQTERERINEHLLKFHRLYVISQRMQRAVLDGKYSLTDEA